MFAESLKQAVGSGLPLINIGVFALHLLID